MKRRTIITSILVIVLCLGLISGSTFALFTSTSSVNIAVTSGKVDVKASLKTPLELYSANASETTTDGKAIKTTDTSSESADGILTGTFAGTYYYKSVTDYFLNGGTASYTAPTLTIDRMTPGDKVATELEITNKSNVAIKYRLKIAATAENDANAKILEVLKVRFEGKLYTGLKNYASSWTTKDALANNASETYKSTIEIIFPLDVDGEDYMDKTVELAFTVEAVQSNANTVDAGTVEYVSPTAPVTQIATVSSVVTVDPNNTNNTTATLVAPTAPLVEDGAKTEVVLTNVAAADKTVKLTVETHDISAAAATQYKIVDQNNTAAGSIDLTLTVNDTVVSQFANNASAKIVTYVAKGLSDVKVIYNGDNNKAFGKPENTSSKGTKGEVIDVGDYFYDSATGELVFITDHFSEYVVTTSAKVLVVETNTGYNTFALGVAALKTNQTLKLLNDCEVGTAVSLTNPLKVTATGATIDLDGKVLTVNNNFSFVIEAKDAVVKNGKIYSAENAAKATKLNSYVLGINNCDGVEIDGIETKGGISVGGSNGETPNAGAATNVTIKNCDVLSGDYYAVCSQNDSIVTIKSGTYTANTGSTSSKIIHATFVGEDGPSGKITVEDGTFVGDIADNNADDIVIKGGKFSVEPAAKYIFSGFKTTLEDDWYVLTNNYTNPDFPYVIDSDDAWRAFVALTKDDSDFSETAGKYFQVTTDLDVTNYGSERANIHYFAGTIDFTGHTFTGLTAQNSPASDSGDSDCNTAIFSRIHGNVKISNLNFITTKVTNGGKTVAAQVTAVNSGDVNVIFDNITTRGSVIGSNINNIGLLLSYINGANGNVTLINCNNYANIIGPGYKSAFLGNMGYGTVEKITAKNCHNYGTIISTNAEASMLISNGGHSSQSRIVKITNCSNEGIISQGSTTTRNNLVVTRPEGYGNYIVNGYKYSSSYTEDEFNSLLDSDLKGSLVLTITSKELATNEGKFVLNSTEGATKYVLSFSFYAGGHSAGGGSGYELTLAPTELANADIMVYDWINKSAAQDEIVAHTKYGTTYYTCGEHYVYNSDDSTIRSEVVATLTAYDADDTLLSIATFTYPN